MNHRDQEKLLQEILPPDDAADFRSDSLAHGLAGLRHVRRQRRVVRFSAVVVTLIGLSLGILFHSRNESQNIPLVTKVTPPQPAFSILASSHVDFISDDQLLAIFTNQPVALIGKPGEQRLVFLGKSEDNSLQNSY